MDLLKIKGKGMVNIEKIIMLQSLELGINFAKQQYCPFSLNLGYLKIDWESNCYTD